MTAITVGITPTEKQQQQKCKQSHIHRNRSLIVAIKYACAKYFFCRLFKMMGDNEDRCHFTEAWLRGQEFKPIRVSHQILKGLFNFLSKKSFPFMQVLSEFIMKGQLNVLSTSKISENIDSQMRNLAINNIFVL